MKKQIEEMVAAWKEKNDALGGTAPNDEKLRETVVNCISLASSWIKRAQTNSTSTLSFEAAILDKDGKQRDRMNGVTVDNLPQVLLDAITFNSDKTSAVELYGFSFVDGQKDIKQVGKLDIV